MHALTGYTDRWSVKPGQDIRFMVSSAGGAPFSLRFARHLCADPNPAGPGYREVTMLSPLDGEHAGQEQVVLGSYGHATAVAIDAAAGLRLTATIWPTLPDGRQGVLSLAGPAGRFTLGLDAAGAFAELVGPDGRVVRASTGTALLRRRWYDVVAAIGADGTLTIEQRPHRPLGTVRDAGEGRVQAHPPPAGAFDVFLAALPGREGHFNGKLER
jgi:N,N-dimethylformamidase